MKTKPQNLSEEKIALLKEEGRISQPYKYVYRGEKK